MRSTHYAHYTFCSPAQYRFVFFFFFLVGSEKDAKMPTSTGQWIIKNVLSLLPKNLKSNIRNLNGILSLGKEICGQSWTTIWEQKYFIGSVKVYETWWNEMSLRRNANTFHVSVLSKSLVFFLICFQLSSPDSSMKHLLWWLSLLHASPSCDS